MKDEKSDADADAVAVAPADTDSTAQPTTAPVVAQNNLAMQRPATADLAMQRPGTAVLATTVTGTYFWADSVIMKVQLDPDHICKVQDTWVIYRVKFTDPAHPHLLGTSFSAAVVSVCLTCANSIADTEAKHVKPIRIRRKPREFKDSKAMSLKQKNDLMYEEFLREKEEREKRMVCLALVLHVGNRAPHTRSLPVRRMWSCVSPSAPRARRRTRRTSWRTCRNS